MTQNARETDRDKLFMELRRVSFSLDELRLFLDTHPTDSAALSMFGEYQTQRKEILDAYVPNYGPVEAYNVDTNGGWGWINEPMPWESEAN